MEEWRATHHPHYEVSNLGRVRSWAPRGGDMRHLMRPCFKPTEPRLLKPGRSSSGYLSVSFGRQYGSQSVHILVAAAFLGPCPQGQECRHKDDNRANPRASNLEYGTRTQNIIDSVNRGRWNRPRKVTKAEVIDIRKQALHGVPHHVIASQYGLSRSSVQAGVTGRLWKRG